MRTCLQRYPTATTNRRSCSFAFVGNTTFTGLVVSLRDALAADGAGCGDTEAVYEYLRPGGLLHRGADILKARADFGYAPVAALDEGLLLVVSG